MIKSVPENPPSLLVFGAAQPLLLVQFKDLIDLNVSFEINI